MGFWLFLWICPHSEILFHVFAGLQLNRFGQSFSVPSALFPTCMSHIYLFITSRVYFIKCYVLSPEFSKDPDVLCVFGMDHGHVVHRLDQGKPPSPACAQHTQHMACVQLDFVSSMYYSCLVSSICSESVIVLMSF
jgi:hypothetical protein